jgi:hypothetical protein
MNQPDDDAARAHLNGLYRAIFEDDKRGEAILLDLQARFVRAPNPRDFTQEGMLRTFVQTHQREVLEYILRRINAAHGVHDDPTIEGQNDDAQ